MNINRPIIMSAPMVRSTLDDIKTQTRRMAGLEKINQLPDRYKLTEVYHGGEGRAIACFTDLSCDNKEVLIKCPYGERGDKLWVRETCSISGNGYFYRADTMQPETVRYAWTPSIHMPRKASRITLAIKDIRVERLKSISEKDAIAEGATFRKGAGFSMDWSPVGQVCKGCKNEDGSPSLITEKFIAIDNARGAFFTFFESLNGPATFKINLWVWVVVFERVKP